MKKGLLFVFVVLSAAVQAQTAAWYIQEADMAFADRRYSAAITGYTNAIRLSPSSAHAYTYRGICRHIQNDFKSAMDDYDQAIYTDAKAYIAYQYRGMLKFDMKNYYGSIHDLDSALLLHPDDAQVLISRARAKKEVREYKSAMTDCDRAITVNHDYGYAYYIRAEIEDRCLRPRLAQAAVRDCDTAISLLGESSYLLIMRGLARSDAQDYTGAIQDYEAVIAIDPGDVIAWIDRSDSRHHLRDYEGSIADCRVAMSLDSTEPLAYINTGNALDSLGDHKGAIEYYERAIHFAERPAFAAEGYCSRGGSKLALGHPQEALLDFDLAIKADPEWAEAYYARALTNIKLKQNRGACGDLKKALEYGKAEAEEMLQKYCK